jgi:electron transfer flavoprotein alpha subunit
MQSAGPIIAVNKDPRAPIFRVADFGLVGDLHVILPRLTESIARYTDSGQARKRGERRP